jgi:ribonuclease P protein component
LSALLLPGELEPTGGKPKANAFPKQYRLTKTDEFSSVFGFRRALKSPHFLLHYRLRTSDEVARVAGARLGLVVAKRLLKRSVDRNLVRRLARENFRLLRSRLPARDVILRLAVRPKPLDRWALGDEIRGLLGKLTPRER